jgi:sporulation protein YlmC with PRC-barrel domain
MYPDSISGYIDLKPYLPYAISSYYLRGFILEEISRMLRSIKQFIGFDLLTENGQFGKVQDLYFDGEDWTIRYLVVSTGLWLFRRRVLIPMKKFGTPNWKTRLIPVSLTQEQIKNAADDDAMKLGALQKGNMINDVIGYKVRADDGLIGRVDDFIFEQDETWLIRSVVIKMGRGFYRKKVVTASLFIDLINFEKSMVHLNLIRETIKNSPVYDRKEHIDKELITPPYRGSDMNISQSSEQENDRIHSLK